MTIAGINIEQRSIILIPFPYTDLSGAKKRPTLVVSSDEFNIKNELPRPKGTGYREMMQRK